MAGALAAAWLFPFLQVRMVSYPARLKTAGRVLFRMSRPLVIPCSRFRCVLPRGGRCHSVRPLMIMVREGEHTAADIDPMW